MPECNQWHLWTLISAGRTSHLEDSLCICWPLGIHRAMLVELVHKDVNWKAQISLSAFMTFFSRRIVTIATPVCLFKSTCIALRSAMHHWSQSPINLKREVTAGSYRIMKHHILKTALQNCGGSLIGTVQLSALITSMLNISTDWRWKQATILTIWTNPYENCIKKESCSKPLK